MSSVCAAEPRHGFFSDGCIHLLPAAEQLYFHDAPLAHVIVYEERLREDRRQRDMAMSGKLRGRLVGAPWRQLA